MKLNAHSHSKSKRTLKRIIMLAIIVGIVSLVIRNTNFKFPGWTKKSYSLDITASNLSKLSNLVPVAIIGSGPAGLSAALYTSRMNMYTVIFKGKMPGGQLMGTTHVENWPGVGTMLGPDIMKKLEQQAVSFGARVSSDSIEKVDFSTWPYKLITDDGKQINALSVIIATGALPKKLNIAGEKEYWAKGVSTCAVCDAPFYKNRVVAVAGGGDSAAEEALQLASVAREVIMLVRGSKLRASNIMQQRLKQTPNITIRYNTQITKINGNGSIVTSLDLANYNANGTTTSSVLTLDGLFLGIGHEPNTHLFKTFLDLDSFGYIKLKEHQMTSKLGVFAAGDVVDFRYRQAGVAAGDGIKAALDVFEFLHMNGFVDTVAAQLEPNYYEVETDTANTDIPVIRTSAEYNTIAAKEKRPIAIDFYAPYCPSCMTMLPIFGSVAKTLGDKIKFIKVDTSQSSELTKRFEVPMIPTLLVLKNGKLISRSTEIMNKRQMREYLEKFI